MLIRIRDRLTYANVVASLALFAALGGSAYAVQRATVTTAEIQKGAVTTKKLDRQAVIGSKIADEAIANRMLRTGAVGANELAAGAVGGSKLADAAVGAAALGDGSVTAPKLADAAVTAGALGDGSVTTPKLADQVVTASKLGEIVTVETTTDPIADGAVGTATAICPAGTVAISGGGFPSTFAMSLTTSIKFGNNWRVQSANNTGAEQSLTARAYCLADSP